MGKGRSRNLGGRWGLAPKKAKPAAQKPRSTFEASHSAAFDLGKRWGLHSGSKSSKSSGKQRHSKRHSKASSASGASKALAANKSEGSMPLIEETEVDHLARHPKDDGKCARCKCSVCIHSSSCRDTFSLCLFDGSSNRSSIS